MDEEDLQELRAAIELLAAHGLKREMSEPFAQLGQLAIFEDVEVL